MGFETFIDEITTTANRGLASGGLIAKFNGISSIELCTKLNICASIALPSQSPETSVCEKTSVYLIKNREINSIIDLGNLYI